MNLDAYILAAAARPWRWGEMDCCQFANGWVRERCGVDVLAGWSYADSASARRLLRAHGGLLDMARSAMATHGFRSTDDPESGDVGVLQIDSRDDMAIGGVALAIRCGRFWVARALRGVVSADGGEVIAWRVG